MTGPSSPADDPFAPVVLATPDGARAEVLPYGAHVTSWRPAPGSEERLFTSATAEYRAGAVIRGGVPVIFPQFATRGYQFKHGFARVKPWRLVGQEIERASELDAPDAVARFALEDDAETRAVWPHAFRAELEVRVTGVRLALALSVENTGDAPFEFTAALHTYLRLSDDGGAELVGLHAARYETPRAPFFAFEDRETLRADAAIDRVYIDAPTHVLLRDGRYALEIERDAGFPDLVVWNPGEQGAAALGDLEPDGWRRMVCVEAAAVVTPVTLEPTMRWRGVQTFTAIPPRG